MNTGTEENAKSKGSENSIQGWKQRLEAKKKLHLYKILRAFIKSRKGCC